MAVDESGGGFDRSYKRGAIMGLTVAEAFILLAFCLLLLFTWWQVDTESKNQAITEQFAGLTSEERADLIRKLSDGSLDVTDTLRKAGVDPTDKAAVADLASMSRFMRNEDLKRLMEAAAKLQPDTVLTFANAVEILPETDLSRALSKIAQKEHANDPIAVRMAEAAEAQSSLVDLLESKLGDGIRAAGGSIDSRGVITLPESVLFDRGQSVVRNPAFLRRFCKDWLSTLNGSDQTFSDIRIEGHASSEWDQQSTVEEAYRHNLNLSQLRASNTLNLCLDAVTNPDFKSWIQAHLAAIGYSSSRLIYHANGEEDARSSRRVTFSATPDQSKLIEDIQNEVSQDNPIMNARGKARVIDGDTIELLGARYQLFGIDAPEKGQLCRNTRGVLFDCGETARLGLERLIAGEEVNCIAQETDHYGHLLAICSSGEIDLSARMVSDGFAVAYLQHSEAYSALEDKARIARTGIWNTEFEMPWDYR